jgi:hypothetical protein
VGPGYARKVEVSRAEAGSWGGREREEDGSSGTEADGGGAWASGRRSKAALEWAASSLWEPFVKRFEVCDDSDS